MSKKTDLTLDELYAVHHAKADEVNLRFWQQQVQTEQDEKTAIVRELIQRQNKNHF